MFLSVLCILMLKLKPSISHFPQHTDLQKAGEVIFNNEKFNILKVTTHTVTDYFEDFMLGKKRPNPTKRLFVDDNSFRHQWSGFNDKPQSLRKTEIIKDTFDKVAKDNISIENNNSSMLPSNSEKEKNAVSNISAATKASSNPDNNENSSEDTNASTIKEDMSEVKYSGKPSTLKRQDDDKKAQAYKKKMFDSEVRLRQREPAKSPDKERTVVQTTFFCPFFGIITMSAFVD